MFPLRGLVRGVVLSGFLVGCAPREAGATARPTDELTPYRAPSPTPKRTLAAPTLPSPQSVGPSPTPLTYVVREGDTLLGIAIRYGLELEQLLAVNPGVNPRALSIGQQIYIPALEGDASEVLLSTPTPVSLALSNAECYPTPAGDVWCGVEILNEHDSSVEGISVLFILFGEGGELLTQDVVFSPLNHLRPDERTPVFAFFEGHAEEFTAVDVRLQSAVVYKKSGQRFVDLELELTRSEPSLLSKRWLLSGVVTVPETVEADEVLASLIVTAVDEDDRVVGYAKWESTETLRPGQNSPFEITVFSLGPAIERVETQTEGLILPANSSS